MRIETYCIVLEREIWIYLYIYIYIENRCERNTYSLQNGLSELVCEIAEIRGQIIYKGNHFLSEIMIEILPVMFHPMFQRRAYSLFR